MGEGTRVSFWNDLRCGDSALKFAFLGLFSIACEKDASMEDNYEVLGGTNQWNVSFSREAHDWEVEVFASFFQVLHTARVRQGGADRLWWIFSKRGCFTVKFLHAS